MRNIEMISIPVSNQEQAKQFYTDKLGFIVVFEGQTPDGGTWLQLGLPDDDTTITLGSGPMFAPAGSIKGLMLSTDDIEKDVEALRTKGVDVPDIQTFPHGKMTSLSDPDGNQWLIRETPKFNS
ncbi:VOC family protein [Olivibacter sitiensis]|uniref:VOC family protein n=1 Tax=Olivibacter sitiensis TaxID=376470 RepID=UPI000424AC0F|nr:VOC family protein [Olivibacter sitiensis]